MSTSSHDTLGERDYNFLNNGQDFNSIHEIASLKKELEVLKNANPLRMAELAIEIQIERLRVVEISSARDATVQRLSDAYLSIREKNELIEQLQQGKGVIPLSPHFSNLKAHIATLEATVQEQCMIIQQQQKSIRSKPVDPPPRYEETRTKMETGIQTDVEEVASQFGKLDSEIKYIPPDTDDPEKLSNFRNTALASIPLPPNPPDATLRAIIIPPPFTLHEFLNGAPAALRNSLTNYRILQNVTTLWCPDREEHGYIYVPLYKCSTNPRISTAHRWAAMDVIGRMSKPTECFYNKEGVWYYAGSYKAFRLDTLSTKEWLQLSTETTSAIVKETIIGRKNSSPQNTYETSQLYAAGALKVACVGLQCVGFNQEVYKSITDYSIKFSDVKWKALAAASAIAQTQTGTSPTVNASSSPTNPPYPTIVKTPVIPRYIHRTSSLLSSASGSGSPSSKFSSPTSTGGVLGFGSSLWNISAGSPGVFDAAAKRVFEGGENLATVEPSGKR